MRNIIDAHIYICIRQHFQNIRKQFISCESYCVEKVFKLFEGSECVHRGKKRLQLSRRWEFVVLSDMFSRIKVITYTSLLMGPGLY